MKKISEETFTVPMFGTNQEEMTLELFVVKTNELNPTRDILELGFVMYNKNEELRKSNDSIQFDNDNDFGIEEIEKLIKYLNKIKKHIKNYNDNSKPLND